MRNLLFLVGGLAFVLLLGFWLAHSMVPAPPAPPAPPAEFSVRPMSIFSMQRYPLWQLLVLAWVSAFITKPRWLAWLGTIAVVCIGGGFIAWDSASTEDSAFSIFDGYRWSVFELGMLILASRLVPVVRWAARLAQEET